MLTAEGLEHWVGKASDERKGEVQVSPEILAKYVGTYEEQRPYWRAAARIVEITVSDGSAKAVAVFLGLEHVLANRFYRR